MAERENIRVCPVCFHDYKFEGEHVPRILVCFHTVCEGCIRNKLWQVGSFQCPQCGTKHSSENDIISFTNKIGQRQPAETKNKPAVEGKQKCSMHGEELCLFCKESGCQMAICVACAKDQHEGHDVGDLEEVTEEICSSLLEDVQWMKDTLEKKMDDYLKVEQIVVESCRECTSEVKDMKADLITKINQRTEKLLNYIAIHKNRTHTRTEKKIKSIHEKLALVQDFQKFAENKTVMDIETKKLQKFKYTKDEINSRSFETTSCYSVLNYVKCDNMSTCLYQLCGKLKERNKEIGMRVMKSDARGPTVPLKTDLEENDSKLMDQNISSGSLQEKGALDILAMTTQTATASTPDSQSNTHSCLRESTPAIDGSHRVNDTPVLVVKDTSMDRSDLDGKSEGVVQPESTSDELVRRVNGLLEKAGKLLPSMNAATPDVTPGNLLNLQSEVALDISTTTAPTVTASTFGRDCSQEKTSAINGSHMANETPDPVVKDASVDQSDASGKSEESALQPENTPDELVRQVNGLLAKAAKLLPPANTAAPEIKFPVAKDVPVVQSNATGIPEENTAPCCSGLQPADTFHLDTAGSFQAPLNSCGSVSGQWTDFEPLINANNLARYNHDGSTLGDRTDGRNTTGSKHKRDSRNHTFHYSGRKEEVQFDAQLVIKKEHLQSPQEHFVIEKQPGENTSIFDQSTTESIQPAVNAVSNNRPAVNAVSNNRPAVNAVSNNRPAVNAVSNNRPAVNAVLNNRPAVNAVSNNRPAVNAVSNNRPAVNAVSNNQPTMNTVFNKQLTTSEDSCEENTTKQPEDNSTMEDSCRDKVEPVAKKARLESTPQDSQNSDQGPWRGRELQN